MADALVLFASISRTTEFTSVGRYAAVEKISGNFADLYSLHFCGNRYVAAIVEGFFDDRSNIGFGG
jgi:predicted HD phosphohydrolase